MELPEDIVRELARLGEHPAKYEWILREEGTPMLRGYLNKVSEAAALCETWLPRLIEFASDKRRDHPLPEARQLTETDLAWRRILGPKILQTEPVQLRERLRAVSYIAPLSVLPLVKSRFAETSNLAVFLTPNEFADWGKVYSHPEGAFSWLAFQQWNVVDSGIENSFWDMWNDLPAVSAGEVPWLVSWGTDCGESAELWAWNGKQERFVADVGQVDF